jgi:putative aldouronate transport system permease protein
MKVIGEEWFDMKMTSVQNSKILKPKLPKGPVKRRPWRTFLNNWELLLLCIPALTCYVLFQYMPMGGLLMAFKDFRYNLGIFGSPWAGFKNFEFLFKSVDLVRIVRNTVSYSAAFIIVNLITNTGVALLLFEIKSRKALKAYQTIMTIPNFLSWVIIGFITYAILNPTLGVLNQFLAFIGVESVDVYTQVKYWPFIIVFMNTWKGVGMGSLMYYASLIGNDPAYYDAAVIDGANRWQQTWYISIPTLIPLMTIMTILAVGGMFSGDFGLFYQIPRNVGVLYEATDIIDTYVFRGLQSGNFGMSSAVGFVQSVVGLILVTLTNYIVGKISPDNKMF